MRTENREPRPLTLRESRQEPLPAKAPVRMIVAPERGWGESRAENRGKNQNPFLRSESRDHFVPRIETRDMTF